MICCENLSWLFWQVPIFFQYAIVVTAMVGPSMELFASDAQAKNFGWFEEGIHIVFWFHGKNQHNCLLTLLMIGSKDVVTGNSFEHWQRG